MRQLLTWLRLKHTSLTQAAATLVGAGQVLGWWTLSATQIAAIMSLVGLVWLIIGANTVTSNLRLTGKAFGSTSGVDPIDAATHAVADMAPIPADHLDPDSVDLSDAETGAGLA